MTQRSRIRPVRLSDSRRLAHMLQRTWINSYVDIMGAETARADARSRYRPHIVAFTHVLESSRQDYRRWIAERNGDVVGYASWSEDPDGEAVLWMLYVDPDHQRQGIGAHLLDEIIRAALRAKAIRLEVLQANTSAIRWYERQGFAIYHSAPTAYSGVHLPVHYMDCPLPRQRSLD